MAELFANTSEQIGTVEVAISAIATTVKSTALAPLPLRTAGGTFRAIIGKEIVLVTGGNSGKEWTIIRGQEGTTAEIHALGSLIFHKVTAGAIEALKGVSGSQYLPLWEPGKTYKVGQQIMFEGQYWICIREHESKPLVGGKWVAGIEVSKKFVYGDLETWKKFRNEQSVFNLQEYGVVAQGQTGFNGEPGTEDQRAKIQAVIDLAAEYGGRVVGEAGVYTVSSQIERPNAKKPASGEAETVRIHEVLASLHFYPAMIMQGPFTFECTPASYGVQSYMYNIYAGGGGFAADTLRDVKFKASKGVPGGEALSSPGTWETVEFCEARILPGSPTIMRNIPKNKLAKIEVGNTVIAYGVPALTTVARVGPAAAEGGKPALNEEEMELSAAATKVGTEYTVKGNTNITTTKANETQKSFYITGMTEADVKLLREDLKLELIQVSAESAGKLVLKGAAIRRCGPALEEKVKVLEGTKMVEVTVPALSATEIEIEEHPKITASGLTIHVEYFVPTETKGESKTLLDGGVNWGGGGMERVETTGFVRFGHTANSNHFTCFRCAWGGWSALCYGEKQGARGDNYFINCDFTNGAHSNIYFEPGGLSEGDTWIGGHMALCSGPCFYSKNAEKAGEAMLLFCRFNKINFERGARNMICDDSMQRYCQGLIFEHCGGVGGLEGTKNGDPAEKIDASWKCGEFNGCEIEGGLLQNIGWEGSEAALGGACCILAKKVINCHFGTIGGVVKQCAIHGRPFMIAEQQEGNSADYSQQVAVEIRTLDAECSRFDLLRKTGRTEGAHGTIFDRAGAIPAGIALLAGAAGAHIPVAVHSNAKAGVTLAKLAKLSFGEAITSPVIEETNGGGAKCKNLTALHLGNGTPPPLQLRIEKFIPEEPGNIISLTGKGDYPVTPTATDWFSTGKIIFKYAELVKKSHGVPLNSSNKGAWVAGTTYAKNDIVTAGGHTYVSRLAGNVGNKPESTPFYWEYVTINEVWEMLEVLGLSQGGPGTQGSMRHAIEVDSFGEKPAIGNIKLVAEITEGSKVIKKVPTEIMERLHYAAGIGITKIPIATGGGSPYLPVESKIARIGPLGVEGGKPALSSTEIEFEDPSNTGAKKTKTSIKLELNFVKGGTWWEIETKTTKEEKELREKEEEEKVFKGGTIVLNKTGGAIALRWKVGAENKVVYAIYNACVEKFGKKFLTGVAVAPGTGTLGEEIPAEAEIENLSCYSMTGATNKGWPAEKGSIFTGNPEGIQMCYEHAMPIENRVTFAGISNEIETTVPKAVGPYGYAGTISTAAMLVAEKSFALKSTLHVVSTEGFPTSGILLCSGKEISYEGLSGTEFKECYITGGGYTLLEGAPVTLCPGKQITQEEAPMRAKLSTATPGATNSGILGLSSGPGDTNGYLVGQLVKEYGAVCEIEI